MNIQDLARERSMAMAILEDLSGRPETTDAAEKREFLDALVKAQRRYTRAEEAFQRAISTLSNAELGVILKPSKVA